MAQEEEDRLNFYSKYTRAKDQQPIGSLYHLIEGAKSTSSLQIIFMSLADRKDKLSRKASASPQRKRSKASARPKEWTLDESEQLQRKNMQSINQKLKKLKKMQRQFHQQMDHRQREMKKRKQSREEYKKERPKYQQNFINVVEIKDSPLPRRQSESKKIKESKEHEEHPLQPVELDFQDYYRQAPEVKINNTYEQSPEVRKQLKQMIEMQRMRQRQVQSVDEDEGKAVASIVIERIDIATGKMLNKPIERVQSKNLCEVQLSHSKSQNTLEQYRFGKYQEGSPPQGHLITQANDIHGQKQEQFPHGDDYSPAKNLIFQTHNEDYTIQHQTKKEEEHSWQEVKNILSNPIQFLEPSTDTQYLQKYEENVNHVQPSFEPVKGEETPRDYTANVVKNRTGTQEGSEIREQIEDKVNPIANRSQQFSKPENNVQASLYYSQTNPNSKLHVKKEVKSFATDSLDFHPLQALNESSSSKKLSNKKSSFKKLMAENRANLVPRMAISTILNEKINEALGDLKSQNAQPAAPQSLQESIIQSEISSPPSKRKINFKQRIVEQLDKSRSRDSRPSFSRDPVRAQKNKTMLVGFFADN